MSSKKTTWHSEEPTIPMLDTWIKNEYNVLLKGRHGVGKTSLVLAAFKNQGWEINKDFVYFNAPTMDPYTDICGVPYVVTDEKGNKSLEIIKPSNIKNLSLQAIFIDEINRSHKKIRNALMELIQFRSINGISFPNLKIVWAAINPEEDDDLSFDVEKLDPAQEDKFHIHLEVPYKPNLSYFAKKYNDPDLAKSVCDWWHNQPELVKLSVSPRRLEYAIDIYKKTGNLKYALPVEASLSSLKESIDSYNPVKTLLSMLDKNDKESQKNLRKWLAIDNNLHGIEKFICENKEIMQKVLHFISDERLISFISKHKEVQEEIKTNPEKYYKVINDLAENSTNKYLKKTCSILVKRMNPNYSPIEEIKTNTPSKKNLNISTRKVKQIKSNYQIVKEYSNCPFEKQKPNEEIKENIYHYIKASSNEQIDSSICKIKEILNSDLNQKEINILIKVLNEYAYTMSIQNEIANEFNTDPFIKNKEAINFLVYNWGRFNDFNFEKFFNTAPFLVTKVLCHYADQNISYLGVQKVKNDIFHNEPDTLAFQKESNDIEDILSE
jgi:hypothetical protein